MTHDTQHIYARARYEDGLVDALSPKLDDDARGRRFLSAETENRVEERLADPARAGRGQEQVARARAHGREVVGISPSEGLSIEERAPCRSVVVCVQVLLIPRTDNRLLPDLACGALLPRSAPAVGASLAPRLASVPGAGLGTASGRPPQAQETPWRPRRPWADPGS